MALTRWGERRRWTIGLRRRCRRLADNRRLLFETLIPRPPHPLRSLASVPSNQTRYQEAEVIHGRWAMLGAAGALTESAWVLLPWLLPAPSG